MRREIQIILFSSIFWALAGGLLGPIYAIFVKQIGGDLLATGGAYAAFSFTAGALMFFFGKLADSAKRPEYLLVFGSFLTLLGNGGYLLVSNPGHLFVVQIILGVSEAMQCPVVDGVFAKFTKEKFSEWGAWETIFLIGKAVAALLGAYVVQSFGFQVLFLLMAFFSFISFTGISILAWRIIEEDYKARGFLNKIRRKLVG